MAAPKGTIPPNAGKGRPKGATNKATREARSVIAAFVDGNAEKVQALWDHVAEKDPAKALELYAKISEFALPKLSRSTVDGNLGMCGKLIIDGG